MGAKRVSKQGVTVSEGNAIEVTNTSGTVLFSINNAGSINTLPNLTAKGSLITASATSTPTTLAVGNNGETLLADSSTSTGLRYQSAYNGNGVINGAFDIWQRGTSIASGAFYPYTADRWQCVRGGVVAGMTVSRQLSGLTSFQYCARIQRDSGNTSTAGLSLYNAFESNNSYQYAGQAVTFSYYARAGANYSGGVLTGNLGTGTGTDQNPITSVYTGSAFAINTTSTLTTTWQRFQGTATLSSSMTEMYVSFSYVPTGTAGANDYVEITGVQVELGSIATTFKRAGGTLQGELAACQRYYYLHASGDQLSIGLGTNTTASEMHTHVQFPVTMRTAPTLDQNTGTNYYRFFRAGAADDFNSFTISRAVNTNALLYNQPEISGTSGDAGIVHTINASAKLAFTAEL